MDPILELAENANAYTPLGSRDERDFTERYVLWMGDGGEPAWNVAQRFRLRDAEVEAVRAEIHARLRAKGRSGCTWEIGTSATPHDLVDRLLALGLVEDEPTALAVGMVLTSPPAAGPSPGLMVRRAETYDEQLASARIAAVAFGGPVPAEVAPQRDPDNVAYLAYVDGEPVARARHRSPRTV